MRHTATVETCFWKEKAFRGFWTEIIWQVAVMFKSTVLRSGVVVVSWPTSAAPYIFQNLQIDRT